MKKYSRIHAKWSEETMHSNNGMGAGQRSTFIRVVEKYTFLQKRGKKNFFAH